MRIITTFTAAIALTIAAATAQAGGLAPEIMERPDVQEDKLAPAGSSINSTYVILGILAALLIAAAVNANNDDNDEDDPAPAAEAAEAEDVAADDPIIVANR